MVNTYQDSPIDEQISFYFKYVQICLYYTNILIYLFIIITTTTSSCYYYYYYYYFKQIQYRLNEKKVSY